MENKINVAQILKDLPKGTKLYSPLFGNCELDSVDSFNIKIKATSLNDSIYTFNRDGCYYGCIEESECILFPSKENRDWNKFQKPYRDGEHMTQTDKDSLLQDLCSRLPYGVKVKINEKIETLNVIGDDDGYYFNFLNDNEEGVTIENIKPYLFPLSSMTKEQEGEYKKTTISDGILTVWTTSTYDWLNKNHFDYRGLIDKGLAIDATGLNLY
jgi:hypothetical protein